MLKPAHHGELLTGWLDDMGLRLSEALGTNQGYWLALQTQRDLWAAKQTAKSRKRIKPFSQIVMASAESAA